MSNAVLCFVAGKSGGHIIPCLTMAQQAKSKAPQTSIVFFSTDAPLDTSIIRNSGINSGIVDTHIALRLSMVSKQRWYLLPVICWLMLRALGMSLYYLHKLKPSAVITTGGAIAIPLCAAAKILRIPTEVYELNVQPGRAVACIAPYVDKVHICFNKTAQLLPGLSCTKTDYPVRFSQRDKDSRRDLGQLGLNPDKKTIFVLGGSQGSQFINGAIMHLVTTNRLLASQINIVHQTGAGDPKELQEAYAQYGVLAYVFNYADNLSTCYNLADMVISRAGSGALFELLFFGKDSLIIPLETRHDSHQYANACEMVTLHKHLFMVLRQGVIQQDNAILGRTIASILRLT